MSDENTQQFDLYLVKETTLARLFSQSPDGEPAFWIPRSQIRDFLKYPATSPMHLPKCLIEIPEWLAEKHGLL